LHEYLSGVEVPLKAGEGHFNFIGPCFNIFRVNTYFVKCTLSLYGLVSEVRFV